MKGSAPVIRSAAPALRRRRRQPQRRLPADAGALREPFPGADALLIANDRLFIGAWYFLLEKGIRVPEELAVLTHANRGRLPMSHIPLTRLEVDPLALTREVFREIAGKIHRATPTRPGR